MEAVPFGVTDVGESVQVELAGAPVHVRATAWLKPPAGSDGDGVGDVGAASDGAGGAREGR